VNTCSNRQQLKQQRQQQLPKQELNAEGDVSPASEVLSAAAATTATLMD